MEQRILLRDVCKTIRGKTILDHINIELEAGKNYGICGRNGSGKTMLLRAIAGLIQVRGEIIVFGQNITAEHCFPDHMGLVIEKTELWSRLSAMENLRLLAAIRNVIGDAEMEQALVRVGLDPADRRPIRMYSMGMKQKLVLAQAIMEKPRLLLLDEPTNGLDDDTVRSFRRILREEQEKGCTSLIATHQREDVSDLCDRIFRMEQGRCREEGSL
ncbi:MAG: ABC transporter ATP-binding protein [Lachnospiraceae bacterium]|nr:ABC transporter ATP-binding protein [Lachnospiraceae bacterium]